MLYKEFQIWKEGMDQFTFLTHVTYGDIKFSRSIISDFYSIAHDDLMNSIRNNVAKV